MAKGDPLTVDYYDIEAMHRAVLNRDWDAIEKVLAKLLVDREAVE
jgi:hypothetical protein